MKIETLKERVAKTKENIAKSTATLERHKTQLNKKAKALTARGINLNDYDKYDKNRIDHDSYWDLCDYEHKLEDIKATTKKITGYEVALKKLEDQLKLQLAADKEIEDIVPEVLDIFLENWKQRCVDFYTKLATEYIELVSKEAEAYELTKEDLSLIVKQTYKRGKVETIAYYSDSEIENILAGNYSQYKINEAKIHVRDMHIKNFRKSHWASDMAMIDTIVDYDKLNETRLNKILSDDVKAKRAQFIKRIKECIGDIKNLKGLEISPKGEINGIAVGTKCKAKVETITAGGYNIQCFHFRVLVNAIK